MDSETEPLQLIADIKFVLWPNTLNASIKIVAKVFDHTFISSFDFAWLDLPR